MGTKPSSYSTSTFQRKVKAKAKVLIIGDDDTLNDEITQGFSICMPEADLVFSKLGQEGISTLKSNNPCLVILDMSIPDVSAWEVLVMIRQISQVPLIFLSYSKNEADIVKSLELGCDTYLSKPIRQLEFMAYVRSVMKRAFK